jgi:hypothetical protein
MFVCLNQCRETGTVNHSRGGTGGVRSDIQDRLSLHSNMLRYVLFIRQDLTKVVRIVVFQLDHPSVLFEVSPIIYLLLLGGINIVLRQPDRRGNLRQGHRGISPVRWG